MDDFQLSEIDKCANSPLYFINTYCKIVNIDEGIIPFKTYDYQDEFINLIHNNRFTVVTMARQLGKSTSAGAYLLWFMMFNPNKMAAIVANEARVAQEILDRVKDMADLLPDWMRSKPRIWNKRRIQLANGSGCIAAAATKAGLRGFTIHTMLIDELAHIDKTKWDAFYTSSFSTIASGNSTKIIAVSTPNGLNAFFDIFSEAESGTSGWKHLKIAWNKHPKRDEEWKRVTLAGMTGDKNRQFAQEHECEFHGSSKTLLCADTLAVLASSEPIKKSEQIYIFENPLQNQNYVITVDSSEGIGEDSQAFSVLKIIKDGAYFKADQVVSFKDPDLAAEQFPYILAKYGTMYNNAAILIELASTGTEIINILFDEIEYENIVFSRTNKREHMGLKQTVSSKRIGCAEFKSLVESGALNIRCSRTLAEARRFIRHNNSYAADKGYNDDLIMGLVNFSYMTKQDDFKSNILEYLQKKTSVTNDFLIPDILYSQIPTIENKRPVNYGNGTFYVGKLQDLDAADLAAFMS